MLVRSLRPADMENVMILMNYYRDQMEIVDEDWDEDAVVQSLKFYASNMQCLALVAVEGYKIVGVLLGTVKKEFYNNKHMAAIQMFYFLPGSGNNEYYHQMYKEFHQWASTVKAEKIMLMDITDNTDSLMDVKDLLDFDTKMFKLFIKDGV